MQLQNISIYISRLIWCASAYFILTHFSTVSSFSHLVLPFGCFFLSFTWIGGLYFFFMNKSRTMQISIEILKGTHTFSQLPMINYFVLLRSRFTWIKKFALFKGHRNWFSFTLSMRATLSLKNSNIFSIWFLWMKNIEKPLFCHRSNYWSAGKRVRLRVNFSSAPD